MGRDCRSVRGKKKTPDRGRRRGERKRLLSTTTHGGMRSMEKKKFPGYPKEKKMKGRAL